MYTSINASMSKYVNSEAPANAAATVHTETITSALIS